MNRRSIVIGGAATVAAAATGAVLWSRQGVGQWREAAAGIRRPLNVDLSGSAALSELVRCATLAASSHNTQPWRFVLGDSALAIVPDFSRRCPVVDPDDHHLFASLGAATENIVQAAPVFGLSATVRPVDEDGRVRIDLPRGASAPSVLAAAIVGRQCSRGLYDGRNIAPADLDLLAAAGRGDGVDIVLLTERPAINAVASLIIAGNTAQFADPTFLAELKHWLRFGYADAVATGDGLFSLTSGNPALPAPVGRALFDYIVSAASENAKCRAQIASSAGLAVFVSERDDRRHWLSAGRAYQRFALRATALGIKQAFLNQAVEVLPQRRHLAELLGLGARRPDFVVRFGYGADMPWSLRRPVAEVIA
ncbi:Tat pathway signal protein [Rhodopseudomonas palustris]|uniref:Acg family FMN-binding oxidoreductase n=1 Tax=Rhodopseudomonas palustris TaxID=1076 RepID=UPI002ACEF558|nr:Tat pathway signal protein [Rhodopseudomonas palustris]WQH00027.1 Tat pathway signal protein [Rhodopseudomonas palustris]